ncbi:hypothetical protein A9Q81_28200 [Gammaproteobacteria bacterium 42_54_T18]|nr:hypothetical protein A9Q81_28200 [Gammaproteobacteria bacterium 42_54_T18]
MDINLLTAMRRGDIVNLKFDQNIAGDYLCKEASKAMRKLKGVMAHTDTEMTEHYKSGHEKKWTDIQMTLPTTILEGGF